MDLDSPWKEFITVFFRWLIKLVLPELYELIDWSKRPQFLDNELRRITPRSETGKLLTDRLVKVWLKSGKEQAILVHVEAQNQPAPNYEERVYTYHARIWLELRLDIVSIVILGDKNPRWRPNRYLRELPGTRLDFQFHAVKLLDLDVQFLLEEAKRRNPAALMLLAFRRAMETESDMERRLETRKQLIALMMEHGYNPEHQAHILRLLEWVIILPETLEQQVEQFVEEYKRQRKTTFVSRFERRLIEQGVQQGLSAMHNSLTRILQRRFGADSVSLRPTIEAIDSLETLEKLVDAALDAPTLEAFEETLRLHHAKKADG